MRLKLTIPAQINAMKNAGIKFEIVSEADAKRYLDANTYYFRIKAYAKNYTKYTETEKQGQYINLDFAYLLDLHEIDNLLRDIILKMTIKLEYYLRVKMLSDFNMTHDDGYSVVQELFAMMPDLKEKIEEEKINTSTCNEMIAKYKDEWAIWNVIEVISLGKFADLYSLFYVRNNMKVPYASMIHPVRMLRNAAAHNCCLINRLKPPYSRNINACYDLRNELMNNVGLSKKAIDNKIVHPFIHDFSTMLYLYSRFVPAPERTQSYFEVKNLFDNRMLIHKDYYENYNVIRSSYDFVKAIVDFYCVT